MDELLFDCARRYIGCMQTLRLPNTGYHNVSLLLILRATFLPVSAFFLLRPNCHLAYCEHNEDQRAPAAIYKQYASPRNGLEEVIRACHPIEPETFRYASLGSAWRS